MGVSGEDDDGLACATVSSNTWEGTLVSGKCPVLSNSSNSSSSIIDEVVLDASVEKSEVEMYVSVWWDTTGAYLSTLEVNLLWAIKQLCHYYSFMITTLIHSHDLMSSSKANFTFFVQTFISPMHLL